MTITALNNQSFQDISIQHTGSVFNAFKIAVANGVAVSDSPVPGEIYLIPETVENNNDVLNYFRAKNIQPATALQNLNLLIERRGIGWMRVESTFIVD